MVDYRHTDSGQTNPLDFSEHMLKSDTEKIGKYNAAVSRSGHRFMPIILDKFGNVLQKTRDMHTHAPLTNSSKVVVVVVVVVVD